ncbi:MAG: (d)CMP kinase [Nitrospiraceae bacterium]|nr:(d)CMP kinase [Nitrospiraceae bacterium]
MRKVIAIDGPSGAGKSTIARMLAQKLGFEYLDTGALYRAVALYLVRLGLRENATDDEVAEAVKKVYVVFRQGRVIMNGADVSDEIRTPEASHFASVFSARRPVREHLLEIQRDAARHTDIVAEGRDMTTVVFPGACRKFYLDASVGERTRRRTLELAAKGFEVNEEEIRMEIAERDARDAGRDIAPLRKADDALFIESTGLPVEKVLMKIMEHLPEEKDGACGAAAGGGAACRS